MRFRTRPIAVKTIQGFMREIFLVLAPWTRQLEMMVAMMAPTNKISPAIKMPGGGNCHQHYRHQHHHHHHHYHHHHHQHHHHHRHQHHHHHHHHHHRHHHHRHQRHHHHRRHLML